MSLHQDRVLIWMEVNHSIMDRGFPKENLAFSSIWGLAEVKCYLTVLGLSQSFDRLETLKAGDKAWSRLQLFPV